MAKRRHEEEQNASSKPVMIAMGAGGLLVGALVVWALTRTVQPTPSAATSIPTDIPVATNTAAAPPVAGDTSGFQPAPAATGTPSTTSTYTPNPPTEDESASVARISVDDLKAQIAANQVTVIDVRDKTSFITSHIPGSYHVPMASVESQVSFLPKGKPIVTYCT